MRKKILFLLLSLLCFAPTNVHAQLMMPTNDNSDVLAKVEAVFGKDSPMIAIAKCESGIRQFNNAGEVIRGGFGKTMIGIFQINESAHAQNSKNMGIDIYSVDGNIAYAKYLFDRGGVKPWAGCVTVPAAVYTTPTAATPASAATTQSQGSPISSNLKVGIVSPEVLTLQQLLNKSGFPVAESGAGSVGNETTRFGTLTREALKKFQCAKQIVCEGTENTTGFGYVGPKTRAALASL